MEKGIMQKSFQNTPEIVEKRAVSKHY